VLHVTHIPNALAIISDGTMRPQLIDDESILNTRRLLVNWVSPNHWYYGYRYGNVAFELDWNQIVANKRTYWVEVIDYNTKACRILITDKDYTDDPQIVPYDPAAGDGPWWWNVSEGVHYRNGEVCLEFMLEFDLSAAACRRISFVKHHDDYCCINAQHCPYKGLEEQQAGARFLAGLIGHDIDVTHTTFDQNGIRGGWFLLQGNAPRDGYYGAFGVSATDPAAPALARATTTAYYRKADADFVSLARLFADRTDMQEAIRALAEAKFPNISHNPLDDL
jgi:hypothetical protein